MLLERVISKVDINPGGTIYNRMVQILAYADDLVVISRSVQGYLQLEQESNKVALRVNGEKQNICDSLQKRK